MEVTDLKAHIHNHTFNPYYILTGVEWRVQRLYIDQVVKVTGKELKYIDAVGDLYKKTGSNLFASKSYVYVVRDDKEFINNEKLQQRLPEIVGNNILFILLTNPDKRTKFYKAYKDAIIDFEPLKPEVLKKYIQREIALSSTNCDKLMEVCEYSYGRCLLEIDKIKQFQVGYGKDKQEAKPYDGCFLQLLNAGVIYQPPKDAIFDFVDAVLDNKLNTTYDLYHQCVAVGEATMVMLTVLYNNAKAVLQVQSCTSEDIAKSTGLTGFQIMGAKKHLNKRRNGDLLNIMRVCQQCQQGIVTGQMDEEFVMEYILCQIM